MKRILIIALLLLLQPIVFSAAEVSYMGFGPFLRYNAFVSAELNKTTFEAGETMEVSLTASSLEGYPLPDVYIIAEITSADIYYPTQADDAGVIFYEKVLPKFSLPSYENKHMSFSYKIPEELANGTYYLNLYMRTPVSLMLTGGVPSLTAAPLLYAFEVSSGGDEFPSANIVRTKSYFVGYESKAWKGPVGAPVEADSTVQGKIFVQNLLSEKLDNLKLVVSVCEWDDSVCSDFLSTEEFIVGSLAADEEKSIDVSVKAPSIPGAYSVRLELADDSKLLSLYRNRLIVMGGTSKIRTLFINDHSIASGDPIIINACIGSSPDHYTNPDFEDFVFEASVKENGGKIISESVNVPILPKEGDDVVCITITKEAPEDLVNYEVCGEITKSGVTHDKYCFAVVGQEFVVYKPPVSDISVEWDYDVPAKMLEMKFTQLEEELPLELKYFIFDDKGVITKEDITADSKKNVSYRIEQGSYKLVVTDLQSRAQKTIELEFAAGTTPADKLPSCKALGGNVCSKSQVCLGDFTKAEETEFCCMGTCKLEEPLRSGDPIEKMEIAGFLLYLIGALIVIFVVAGIIIRRSQQNQKEEGDDYEF